jgi:hypothetical protein
VINLVVTISGIILAAAGFEFGDAWGGNLGVLVGIGGTALSIGSAVWQYKESISFELNFEDSDWIKMPDPVDGYSYPDEGNELRIPAKKHRKGTGVHVTVFVKTEAGFETVGVGSRETESGTVILTANPPFKGKVVIR